MRLLWHDDSLNGFTRIILLFNGQESEALGMARTARKDAIVAGHDGTYWKETPGGRWEKQG